MLFLYKKWHGLSWRPSVKIIFIYFVMMLLVGGAFAYNVKNKESKKHSIGQDLIQQFDQLPLIGDPNDQYSAKIHMAYETFSKAPIRLSIFSDFQCPACKMFSDLIPAILKRYRSFVNIQYFYYPLDKACNHNIKDDFHGYACQAAYVAECSKNQFLEVHDHIFKEQDKLSEAWIQNYIRQHKLESCVKDMRTRKAVEATILEGDKFSVSSTPTIIFNGVKIGLVPVHHLFLIFDELIAREGKNKKR
jgi:protein-disulfide isomerase